MTKQEYEKLQAVLDKKLKQRDSRYCSRTGNRWKDGWQDALLSIKSILSNQFKEV